MLTCFFSVIVTSGLGGHAFGSFKEKGGPFMWLRDALPLDVPGARILIYGYDTRLIRSSSFQNLTDLGRAFQIDLRGIRELNQERPMVFIGHSLGGLVIKEVALASRTIFKNLHHMLTVQFTGYSQVKRWDE